VTLLSSRSLITGIFEDLGHTNVSHSNTGPNQINSVQYSNFYNTWKLETLDYRNNWLMIIQRRHRHSNTASAQMDSVWYLNVYAFPTLKTFDDWNNWLWSFQWHSHSKTELIKWNLPSIHVVKTFSEITIIKCAFYNLS
jgi:hypothetical protein